MIIGFADVDEPQDGTQYILRPKDNTVKRDLLANMPVSGARSVSLYVAEMGSTILKMKYYNNTYLLEITERS
jgi:hypothetical protein